MAETTKIEWCDSTFNGWIGCSKCSPGCDNCYAERSFGHRFNNVAWGPGKPRKRTSEANWKKPLAWNNKCAKTGTRQSVFCGSLCDVFDPEVPHEWLNDLLQLIRVTPNLDWLLLTKRPEHKLYMFYPYTNCWIGVTVCNQKEADEKIPKLSKVRPWQRFISVEPMLGRIDLSKHHRLIDWVICGGETGPNARRIDVDWVRSLREQCFDYKIPFFFKQWGSHQSGCKLDGQEYKEFPKQLQKGESP